MDLEKKSYSLEYAGQKLEFETSKIAGQANASVIGRYGDSVILVTAVMSDKDVELPYFPLRIEYQERFYAVGKILGARYVRREGRPSDESVLAGRLIDRTLRPLFNKNMRREIQLVITTLSLDPEQDPDFLGLLTASLALSISDIPWSGPVAGVKLIQKEGKLELSSDKHEDQGFDFAAFVSGTKDRVNMIELEGLEAKEEDLASAFERAQKEISKLVEFQEKIVGEIGKEKAQVEIKALSPETEEKVKAFATSEKIDSALYVKDNKERSQNISALEDELKEHLQQSQVEEEELALVNAHLDQLIDDRMHQRILKEDLRVDSRPFDEVRELYSEAALFPRTHGSALFSRGKTQSLAVTTLAGPGQDQIVENSFFIGKHRFMLHYNFPPYSVGEVGMFRGASRRDIGHGTLARKAIKNMLPSLEEFPYAIRVVSEILSSNGSSSMATVCASTLSLMDAGVPMKKPVAGIAMGLITASPPAGGEADYKILTDIQGPEDHFGDADFKVAGTDTGVTAMQMDVKIDGLTLDMLKDAMQAAKKARLQILEHMRSVLAQPREELSKYAPLILKIRIPVDKIGELIGPGGKTINGIVETTGAESIDIEDDGLVFITAEDQEKGKAALAAVQALMKDYEVGEIVEGKIIKILEFGAIVDLGGGKDGMIHVSELKNGFVEKVEDVVKEGQSVKAKVVKVDNGKIGLSLKALEKKKV